MSSQVTQRPRARLDLLEQFVCLGEQAGVDSAERYFAAVDATCLLLADQSLSGVSYDPRIARLKGLRRMPVRGFASYLLFYVPCGHGIDLLRVLHTARDIDGIFAVEEA